MRTHRWEGVTGVSCLTCGGMCPPSACPMEPITTKQTLSSSTSHTSLSPTRRCLVCRVIDRLMLRYGASVSCHPSSIAIQIMLILAWFYKSLMLNNVKFLYDWYPQLLNTWTESEQQECRHHPQHCAEVCVCPQLTSHIWLHTGESIPLLYILSHDSTVVSSFCWNRVYINNNNLIIYFLQERLQVTTKVYFKGADFSDVQDLKGLYHDLNTTNWRDKLAHGEWCSFAYYFIHDISSFMIYKW